MADSANKVLIRRLIDEVWNAHDVGKLPEFWDEQSSAEVVALAAQLAESFPDIVVHIDDLFGEDDRVVVRLTMEGTHQGEFRGFAPTGRPVRFGTIRIYRIADGKVVESWAYLDEIGLLRQVRGGEADA